MASPTLDEIKEALLAHLPASDETARLIEWAEGPKGVPVKVLEPDTRPQCSDCGARRHEGCLYRAQDQVLRCADCNAKASRVPALVPCLWCGETPLIGLPGRDDGSDYPPDDWAAGCTDDCDAVLWITAESPQKLAEVWNKMGGAK